MRVLRAWVVRLGSLFRKGRLERELADEMESHLEMHIADNIAAGMSPAEARRQARLKLGGVESTKESYRDRRGIPWLESIVRDVAYSVRTLRRNRGFTAVAILTLALGIGANTAIFSVFDAVMLRELPVPQPERLVFPRWTANTPWRGSFSSYGGCDVRDLAPAAGCSFTVPAFELFRSRARSFSGIGAYYPGSAQAQIGGSVTRLSTSHVSGEFFSTLGIAPGLGRLLDAKDDRRDSDMTVVLSDRFWRKEFAGDPGVIGKTLPLNNVPFTIVGVTPPEFYGLQPVFTPDAWVSFSSRFRLAPESSLERDSRADKSAWLWIIARLAPGVPVESARSELAVLFRQALSATKDGGLQPDANPGIVLASAAHGLDGLRMQYSRPLRILMVVVGLLLLIACANIANLMLARASTRRREIAVRLAIGAGRARLVRQLMTESLLLAIAGAALGVLIAGWASRGLVSFMTASLLEGLMLDVRPNMPVLAFTAAITIVATIFSGLVPALLGTRIEAGSGLKAGGDGSAMRQRSRFGRLLVVGQMSVALMLLIGAGLFLRTLVNLLTIDPGFRKDHLLVMQVSQKVGAPPDQTGVSAAARERLESLPGVVSASWTSNMFLVGNRSSQDVRLTSRPDLEGIQVDTVRIGQRFFDTMKIPVLTGRNIMDEDLRGDAVTAWVNEALARKYYPGGSPVGDSIPWGKSRKLEIVGVIGDFKAQSVRDEVRPTAFIPGRGSVFIVRTATDASHLGAAARKAVEEVAPSLLISDVRSQEEHLDRALFSERLMARLVTIFGGLAVALAAIGIYGLFAYSVARRTAEIAVRISVGATSRNIWGMVLGDGLRLAAAGACLGLLASALLAKRLTESLFGVQPFDPVTYAGASLVLIGIAVLACYIPARRAVRVEPLTALRSE